MVQWNPDDYRRNSGAQQRWARELMGRLELGGDERILDVGCGDGKVTAELAAAVPRGRVVGVDLSAEMVGFARQAFPQAEHPNLSFAVADASALPYRAEFDVVFSNATLHWVRDHRPVLAGIAAALVPGGRALLQMGGRGNAGAVFEAVDVVLARPGWAPFFAGFENPYGFFGDDEYRALAEAAGLKVERVELIPKDMEQAGREGLLGWLRTTWLPYLERVSPDRRDALAGEVVDEVLRRHPPAADGTVRIGMVRLEAQLRR